jgi:hypothetical protein
MYKNLNLKVLISKSNKSLRIQLENKNRICLNINKSDFIKSEITKPDINMKVVSLYNSNEITYKTYRYILTKSYPLKYLNKIEKNTCKLFTEWAAEGGVYSNKYFNIKV